MKNGEKFEKEIWDKACKGLKIAVIDGSPKACFDFECKKCEIETTCFREGYRKAIQEWCEAEYEEPKITIPADTPVDTKILVSNDGENWSRRHFAEVKDGILYAWNNGSTSWSNIAGTNDWIYGKLAEESDGT